MDLNLLKIFVKVAESGSLTKASKLLGHPKSKLSRDLVKLEDTLELNLLIRSPRGIVLTDQGRELLKSIKGPLDNLGSSIDVLKSKSVEMKGTIKITAPEDLSTHILTRLITDFMDIHPEVSVELYSTNEFLDFKKHHVDLALRIGKLQDSALIQRKIFDIDVGLIASTQYIKSSAKIRTLKDLDGHSIALFKDLYGNPMNKEKLKEVTTKFSSNSIPVLKDFVSLNKGIATLPSFICKKELATKEFTRVLPNFNYINRTLFLLSQHATYTPMHVKAFKDFLFDQLKKESF